MNILNFIADLVPAAGFLLLIFLIAENSVLMKKNGVRVNDTGIRKTVNIKWLYPFFAIFLLLFLIEIFNPLHRFSLLPKVVRSFFFNSFLFRLTGVFAVFLSVYLMKTTLKHFGNSIRFGMNENNTGKLVTSGVFARTRNPFFLSLLLFFTGTALIFPNLFFLFYAVSSFAGIHFSILKEEKFLQMVYGEEYIDYKRKVRRYI